MSNYKEYIDHNCGAFSKLVGAKYKTPEFKEYVIVNNKADRDAGELGSISEVEILRLKNEFDKIKL
jgi:hypothetical protein